MVSSRNKSAIPRGAGACQPGPHQANGSSYRGSGLTDGLYTQSDASPELCLASLYPGYVWEIPKLVPASQTKAGECNVRYGEPAADDRHIHNARRLAIHKCA